MARRRTRWFAAVFALACVSTTAAAQAVINNGTIRMGIRAFGDLNTGDIPQITGTSTVGLRLITSAGDYESTADGCTCEGWGVSASHPFLGRYSGYANLEVDGVVNLTAVSFASTPSTATSKVRFTTGLPVEITHEYRPSAVPNLFEVNVTIRNTGATDLTELWYRRVMDWDISPTQFAENVRISGWGATNLIGSGSNGFLSAQPRREIGFLGTVGCTVGMGTVCNGNFESEIGADRGSFFDFDFGGLAAGSSRVFQAYYGAAPTLDLLLGALGSVGAEVYSAAWCAGTVGGCAGKNGPAVFGYGVKGVGGAPPPELLPMPDAPTVVPEPSAYVLLAAGLAGLARYSRRGQSTIRA